MGYRRRLGFASVFGAVLLASCLQSASAPSPSPTAPSPSPTIVSSSATPLTTTAQGTAPAAAKPSPRPVAAERPSDLVIRLELAGDTCCPIPWAVLTADGRSVTRTDEALVRERRLTPAGVQLVRDEIASTGLFERDQQVPLEPRPGASAPQRGVGALLFKVWRDTRSVEVGTATDQGADEVFFQPSAARTRLDRLSKQLLKPETWLPANPWADSVPRAYEAATFALLLRTEIGQANERPMIDTVQATWPFSVGPLDLGQPLPATAGPGADMTRCSVLTREDMVAVANAMVRASEPDPVYTLSDGTLLTSFARADNQGRLVVTLRPLLPDRRSCNGEYTQ